MINPDELHDRLIALFGAQAVAAYDAGCLCRWCDPSPVCPVHSPIDGNVLIRDLPPASPEVIAQDDEYFEDLF